MSNLYNIFGNIVRSEIEFPEFSQTSGAPTLSIELGKCPNHLSNIVFKRGLFENTEDEFLLNLEGIAKFWVSRPFAKIIVEPYNQEALLGGVQTFILGSVISAWLYKSRLIPLHVGMVKWSGRNILIGGISGAGKSSTITSLMQLGAQVYSDDITIYDPKNKCFIPGLPYIKLWKDGLDYFNLKSVLQTRSGVQKYHIKRSQSDKKIFLNELSSIYVLDKVKGSNIEKESYTGLKKFEFAKQLYYRPEFVKATSFERLAHGAILDLIGDLPCYKIGRPADQKTFDLIPNYLKD